MGAPRPAPAPTSPAATPRMRSAGRCAEGASGACGACGAVALSVDSPAGAPSFSGGGRLRTTRKCELNVASDASSEAALPAAAAAASEGRTEGDNTRKDGYECQAGSMRRPTSHQPSRSERVQPTSQLQRSMPRPPNPSARLAQSVAMPCVASRLVGSARACACKSKWRGATHFRELPPCGRGRHRADPASIAAGSPCSRKRAASAGASMPLPLCFFCPARGGSVRNVAVCSLRVMAGRSHGVRAHSEFLSSPHRCVLFAFVCFDRRLWPVRGRRGSVEPQRLGIIATVIAGGGPSAVHTSFLL